MKEQEIREMIEEQNGICLFGCKEEIDSLVKALHQKFEEEKSKWFEEARNIASYHKQALIDSRIEELESVDMAIDDENYPKPLNYYVAERIAQLKKESGNV